MQQTPADRMDIAPRLARGIVVAVSAALVSIHFLKGLGRVAADPAPGFTVALVTAAVFALHLRFAVPGLARRMPAGWSLAAEVTLGYAAVLPLGVSVGLLCLPVAALLAERRWSLSVLAIAGAAWVEAVRAATVRDTVDMTSTVALGGVVLYGITRLASVVADVHTARLTLAMSAVTAERLRIAGELDEGLSRGLGAIRDLAAAADEPVPTEPGEPSEFREPGEFGDSGKPRKSRDPADLSHTVGAIIAVARDSLATARATAADFRSLSLAPEAATARVLLTSAGIEADVRVGHSEPLGPAGCLLAMVLREAATAVVQRGDARHCTIRTVEHEGRVVLRVVDDGVPTAALGADPLEGLAHQVGEAGGRLTSGLDPDGHFVVEASVAATPRPVTPPDGPELRLMAALYYFLLACFCLKALLFLPVRLFPLALLCLPVLCALQIHYSVRDAKKGGRLGLVLLAAVAFVPLYWFGRNWVGVPGFLAGSLLVAVPLGLAVPLVAAVMVLSGIITGAAADSVGQGADGAVSTLVTGLIVFGLLRLARLVRELNDATVALERAAVLQERLRAARDLHDLLGHSLAAIVLKAELAYRLVGADPERARAELRDIAAAADRARADLRTVTGDPVHLAFGTELAAAASVLAAADVTTEVDDGGGPPPLPPDAERALSAVLREAVTNILRHSAARDARIAVRAIPGSVRLDVENDGVSDRVTPPGSGLGNLTVRLADLGGTLVAGVDDGWYLLRAEVPVRPALPAQGGAPGPIRDVRPSDATGRQGFTARTAPPPARAISAVALDATRAPAAGSDTEPG